jgi:hypothetical protein
VAQLAMAMGGRAAEEIIFGAEKVSNGASGDIKMATDQARRMVTEWGMSESLGMIAYGDNSQELFLGHSVQQNKSVSEHTAQSIDREIKTIIDTAYLKAKTVLTEHLDELNRLARGLLEYETLSCVANLSSAAWWMSRRRNSGARVCLPPVQSQVPCRLGWIRRLSRGEGSRSFLKKRTRRLFLLGAS